AFVVPGHRGGASRIEVDVESAELGALAGLDPGKAGLGQDLVDLELITLVDLPPVRKCPTDPDTYPIAGALLDELSVGDHLPGRIAHRGEPVERPESVVRSDRLRLVRRGRLGPENEQDGENPGAHRPTLAIPRDASRCRRQGLPAGL